MDNINILRAYCVIHDLHFVNVQERRRRSGGLPKRGVG